MVAAARGDAPQRESRCWLWLRVLGLLIMVCVCWLTSCGALKGLVHVPNYPVLNERGSGCAKRVTSPSTASSL